MPVWYWCFHLPYKSKYSLVTYKNVVIAWQSTLYTRGKINKIRFCLIKLLECCIKLIWNGLEHLSDFNFALCIHIWKRGFFFCGSVVYRLDRYMHVYCGNALVCVKVFFRNFFFKEVSTLSCNLVICDESKVRHSTN